VTLWSIILILVANLLVLLFYRSFVYSAISLVATHRGLYFILSLQFACVANTGFAGPSLGDTI